MKKQLSRFGRCWFVEIAGIAIVLVIVAAGLICLINERTQTAIAAREEYVKKLWQQYEEKANEEELWKLAMTSNYKPKRLKKLAAHAFVERTSSRKHLIRLLGVYDDDKEIRIKAADKLLQDPSIEALKSIINKVPERAELAVPILIHQAHDPNIIGYSCFLDIITNAPAYRKWAWKNVLSRPDWIRKDIQYCLSSNPDFPDAAADVYFKLPDLKPHNYRWIIRFIDRLRNRAWKEFMLTKPKNEEISGILIFWSDEYPAEIRILAAKYILANNPSENELKLIEKECPGLKDSLQEGWKKFREREAAEKKKALETKEGILERLENLL